MCGKKKYVLTNTLEALAVVLVDDSASRASALGRTTVALATALTILGLCGTGGSGRGVPEGLVVPVPPVLV